MKVLALRRPDACSRCSRPLAAGPKAAWDAVERRTYCLSCQTDPNPPTDPRPLTPTAAVKVTLEQQVSGGVSAQREHDKRSARREQQIRQQHPRLGGLLLALSKEPTSTRVWAQGAAGERAVAAKLDALVGDHVAALHDRRLRRPDGTLSKANINHIAVTPSGVWVIDAKTHQGSLEVRRSGGLFSPRVETLYINGRDQTRLIRPTNRDRAAFNEVMTSAVPVDYDGLAEAKAKMALSGRRLRRLCPGNLDQADCVGTGEKHRKSQRSPLRPHRPSCHTLALPLALAVGCARWQTLDKTAAAPQ